NLRKPATSMTHGRDERADVGGGEFATVGGGASSRACTGPDHSFVGLQAQMGSAGPAGFNPAAWLRAAGRSLRLLESRLLCARARRRPRVGPRLRRVPARTRVPPPRRDAGTDARTDGGFA